MLGVGWCIVCSMWFGMGEGLGMVMMGWFCVKFMLESFVLLIVYW